MSNKIEALFNGAGVFNKNGEKVNFSDCNKVGLYFTASWCPPCRAFTPVLNEAYKEAKAAGKKSEVVFVSCDQDQASYDAYYQKMDFARLDFNAKDVNKELSTKCNVSGIPKLVFFDDQGNITESDGRGIVTSKGSGAFD